MVLGFALPLIAIYLYVLSLIEMPTVVLKLFAEQGNGQTDKSVTICVPFGEHKKDTGNHFNEALIQNI